nr:hypothetical protein [Tanacetum cinerariifolium]
MIQSKLKGSTQGYPLVSVEVLSVRIKGSVLSASFERKRFRATNFLLRFCNSLTVLGIKIIANVGKGGQEKASDHEYILLPLMPSSTQSSDDKDAGEVPDKGDEGVSKGSGINDQDKTDSSTQDVGTAEPSINTASININTSSLNINTVGLNDHSMPSLEETGIYNDVYDDREVGAEADTTT